MWWFVARQALYKTQSQELREELDDKTRVCGELEEERTSLAHQLQIALSRADSEALARSVDQETIAELEKVGAARWPPAARRLSPPAARRLSPAGPALTEH